MPADQGAIKDDRLHKIRGLLGHVVTFPTERQQAKITACLHAGDLRDEVKSPSSATSTFAPCTTLARRVSEQSPHKVLGRFNSCAIFEVARPSLARVATALGRNLQPDG